LDFRATSDTYLLNIRKRKLPGACRNCLDIPRSRNASQGNRQRCRCYPTAKSDTQRDGVSSNHTLADSYLHSNRHSCSDSESFHHTDFAPTAAFAAFENTMAVHRHWAGRRGVGFFHIQELETESGNRGATRVLSACGLGRSAEAPRECVHQLRVIFSSQCICRPGPPRD
jgi:hypothetical protein